MTSRRLWSTTSRGIPHGITDRIRAGITAGLTAWLAASALVLLATGSAAAELAPKLTNDDLCGTSLLGDEGSQGRSDETWNRRLEDWFRSGGGLVLRQGRIDHDGPPDDVAIAWLGPKPAQADPQSGAWSSTEHLSVERFEVGGVTVVEVSMGHSAFERATVFVWFPQDTPAALLAGAAVLVSNDAGTEDDNGYFVRSWSNQSTGSATLEWPGWKGWPRSGGPRLALDVTYKSTRVGIAGSLRALVAVDRIPEGDPTRIGRFLWDAGIVRAPCLHQSLDPDALEKARKEMAREEASAVIRAAAEFVALDALHVVSRESGPSQRAEVRCPGGRAIAEIALYSDAAGTARRLTAKTTRAKSIDEAVYSYDAEGRLRFVRVDSVRRDAQATGLLEIWYDETGREAGSKSAPGIDAAISAGNRTGNSEWLERPRPGPDPSAEIAWVKAHETELKQACEPGW